MRRSNATWKCVNYVSHISISSLGVKILPSVLNSVVMWHVHFAEEAVSCLFQFATEFE